MRLCCQSSGLCLTLPLPPPPLPLLLLPRLLLPRPLFLLLLLLPRRPRPKSPLVQSLPSLLLLGQRHMPQQPRLRQRRKKKRRQVKFGVRSPLSASVLTLLPPPNGPSFSRSDRSRRRSSIKSS
jgi:hypothetical protein